MGVGRKEGKAPALPRGCEASLFLERSRTKVTDTWAVHSLQTSGLRLEAALPCPQGFKKGTPKAKESSKVWESAAAL